MARARQETIAIADITFDEALYPRQRVNPLRVTRLQEVFDAGAQFPPIIVERGTNRLVDGAHRVEVYRRREVAQSPVEYRVYASEGELFAEAVRLNAEHGEPLTAYDLKNAILRLTEMGYERDRIAGVVRMTPDKVSEVQKGFAQGPEGQPVALKGGLAHKRSQVLSPQQQIAVRRYGGGQATFYANQLLMLLDNDLWPHESVAATTAMDKLVSRWLEFSPNSEAA